MANFLRFRSFFKNISLSILILFFSWILFQLGVHHYPSPPLKLPASNEPVELYSNQTGDDLTLLIEQAIENAKESVTLSIYSLTDRRIIQALRHKIDEGIPVTIVSDGEASRDIPERLQHAAIVKRYGEGLMHQKILIIDKKQIWLGSANFTPSSFKIHGNLILGIDHPELATALTDRIESMTPEGGYQSLLHQETTAGPQTLELWVLPDDPKASMRIIDLFRRAKKSIRVALFTWTRVDFANELIAAKKRGIKVEAIIDRSSGKGASAKIVRLLEQGGIPVRLSTGNKLLHYKFCWIDEHILVNGSANWTYRAFKDNDDVFIIVDPLTPGQQTKMDHLWHVLIKESLPATI